MKAFSIILLSFGLQLAISPLCLCLGADIDKGNEVPSCCHAPASDEPAPCPHCNQEMPISATTPAKASFDSEPPEWQGFPTPAVAEATILQGQHWMVPVNYPPDFCSGLPPLPVREFYGVFQI